MNVRGLWAAAAAFTGLLGPAFADPVYQVIDLGFNAVAINDRGQVVGNNASGAVIWDPVSGTTQIGPGVARDINNSGRVLGVDGSNAGWIWDPVFGLAHPTGLLDPRVMNDLGQVAGPAPYPLIGGVNGGYLWDPTFGYTSIINPGEFPQGSTAEVNPRGINNHGDVVGYASFGEAVPFYWEPGFPRAQALLNPPSTGGAGSMYAVNDLGQMAGASGCTGPGPYPGGALTGESCTQAIVWSELTPTLLGVGAAFDINNFGWVVGRGGGGLSAVPESAFLWSDSFGWLDLSSLVSSADPVFGKVTFLQATDINDRGQILADGHYLLNKVPEPGTFVLTALGIVFLVLTARRSRRLATTS